MSITDWEKDKLLAAVKKWIDNEPLSRGDMERLIWMLDNCQLQLEMLDNQTAAGLQIKLRSTLAQRFLPPQMQQQLQGQSPK